MAIVTENVNIEHKRSLEAKDLEECFEHLIGITARSVPDKDIKAAFKAALKLWQN